MGYPPLAVENYGNNIIEVHQDTDPMNPREWDNLGRMVIKYDGYLVNEGNINFNNDIHNQDWTDFDSFIEYLKREKEAVVVLPLRIYDHSGLSLSVGIAGGWDSSQVGAIYVTEEDIIKEFGGQVPAINVESILRNEVKLYDKYLQGDFYGYVIKAPKTCESCHHTEEPIVDSCWGYGTVEEAMQAAKDIILV